VLDASDNFDTRYLVNRTCVAAGPAAMFGRLSAMEGSSAML